MKRIYILYSDESQIEILAIADSIEEKNKITKEHSSGQWYSYKTDEFNDHVFYADSERKISATFSTELEVIEEQEEKNDWAAVAGQDLRS
jgi:hypothetical protein